MTIQGFGSVEGEMGNMTGWTLRDSVVEREDFPTEMVLTAQKFP